LFVIPHYFGSGTAGYGATDQAKRAQRVAAVQTCLLSLHQHFGSNQHILPWGGQPPIPANRDSSHTIDIVVCVNGSDHLLDEPGLPVQLYEKHTVLLDDPLKLGFACYDVLRQRRGNYDWYCYLEDDLIISDPLFFHKLKMFYDTVGHDAYLLQPVRFETSSTPTAQKAYVDGPLWENNLMEEFAKVRPVAGVPEVNLETLGASWRMVPAANPHSGCFFLLPSQLERMLSQPWCGAYDTSFCGPMESAASLYIMAFFTVYKPAPDCSCFLELHHFHQRYVT
jgi:hypothetical protein